MKHPAPTTDTMVTQASGEHPRAAECENEQHGTHDPGETALEAVHMLAHALASALANMAEHAPADRWRVRVAAAQARAVEDLLAGFDDDDVKALRTSHRRRAMD